MLSDESSSDSETGRFKCRSEKKDEETKKSEQRDKNFRSTGRSRPSENDRFRREFERKRDERDRFERHSRERNRFSRHSPISRRRRSREKSPYRRRSRERLRNRSNPKEHRSTSRDRQRRSYSKSHKSPVIRKDLKERIKQTIITQVKNDKPHRRSRDTSLSKSSEHKNKKSEIHKPKSALLTKRKSESPIMVEEHVHSDDSDVVKPGSYYSMIPAVVKEKSEESSEIDSSDDEKLRAKLLNLEKELHKTRKRRHKKKHKKKTIKFSKDKDQDTSMSVEVSSTTDIQNKAKADASKSQSEVAEVTSTQKGIHKESSEEGEILSDDDSQTTIDIDPNDLRHKLKRSAQKTDATSPSSPNLRERLKIRPDVCGPALPPHLEKQFKQTSPDVEGPALPPHLERKHKNLGPAIPDEMRKVLAETEHVESKYECSDEDPGIGPLPDGSEDKWSKAHLRLEERAIELKMKKLDGQSLKSSEVKSREQWMLELPEAKAKYLGLEARSFRAREGPDMSDRSGWTDTPEEKARKEAGLNQNEDTGVTLHREARARHIATRDEEQEKAVKKHKKKHKREESLLDMHQKKLKKKKKKDEKDEGKSERRPFSRDTDLQVNRFDEAQKRSIIKKAQNLDSRFSRGEAKYL